MTATRRAVAYVLALALVAAADGARDYVENLANTGQIQGSGAGTDNYGNVTGERVTGNTGIVLRPARWGNSQ